MYLIEKLKQKSIWNLKTLSGRLCEIEYIIGILPKFMKIHKQKITEIPKERYKIIVSKPVKEHAIIELIERKDKCVSEYARRKLITY